MTGQTAAGSILTAEARHSAFARLVNGYSPFVMEDTPQSPTAVTSMAAGKLAGSSLRGRAV